MVVARLSRHHLVQVLDRLVRRDAGVGGVAPQKVVHVRHHDRRHADQVRRRLVEDGETKQPEAGRVLADPFCSLGDRLKVLVVEDWNDASEVVPAACDAPQGGGVDVALLPKGCAISVAAKELGPSLQHRSGRV